jgi:hypothetical protein
MMATKSTMTDFLKRVHLLGIASTLVVALSIGAQAQQTGSIGGVKWCDTNGNAKHDSGEPGLAGVVIYSDLNRNGELDDAEPRTITGQRFGDWFIVLEPGTYEIREVVPEGFVQTFPPLPSTGSGDGAYYEVTLAGGDNIGGIDFGNMPFANCTVVIDGCDSGVTNDLLDDTTISDLVAECADEADDHGGFVNCVAHLTNDLNQDGIITGQEKGAIQSCAAQADIP